MRDENNELTITNPEAAVKANELTLDEARKVLEAVRNTDESSFNEGTDLSRVGEYGMDDMRQAFMVVTKDIVGPPRPDWPKIWPKIKLDRERLRGER